MNLLRQIAITCAVFVLLSQAPVYAACFVPCPAVVYSDEATFRAAAGSTTTYGFETHSVVEATNLVSPVLASDLDNSFQLAYANLNLFEIIDGDPIGSADGTHSLFTHSMAEAPNYTLTFSDFGGVNASITAFGFTITDFASNIGTDIVTISYDTGSLSDLLLVTGVQGDFTQNFIGLIVDAADAFTSITLTFTDVQSGFQSFDEIIFSSPTGVPEPATLALLCIALAGLAFRRRKRV